MAHLEQTGPTVPLARLIRRTARKVLATAAVLGPAASAPTHPPAGSLGGAALRETGRLPVRPERPAHPQDAAARERRLHAIAAFAPWGPLR